MPSPVVAELVTARERAGLFFDVDGVLAPIVARPEQARVPASVRRALGDLVGRYRLVALVSGRALDDAARMVDLDGVVVVGDHGRELRDGRGVTHRIVSEERCVLEGVAAELIADETLARAGVRVELKPASIALHVRGASDEAAALAAAAAAATVAGPELVLHRGRAVVDLKLPGVDKGTAVTGLVEEYGLEAALYVGDDRTDVDAMRALRLLGAEEGSQPASTPDVLPTDPPGRCPTGRPLSPLILVGVQSDEMPRELAAVADYLVPVEAVLGLLEALRPSDAT
ncbi:MAG: trehalose-phosphatase [Thermoleophilia bacterium]